MKHKKRPILSSKAPAARDLSNMESINEIENDMADEPDRGSIEAVERDYEGRSSDEEDGAIPMDPADQDPVPEDALRKPSRPPRHNI